MKWDKIASDKIAKIQVIDNRIKELERARTKLKWAFIKEYGLNYETFDNVYNTLKWR